MDKILQLDNKSAVQIAGPTASGKSALALKFAKICDGEIINTDSMQVYDILNVLTARPPQEDLDVVPHHLYGHIQPGAEYSTGHWLKDVKNKLQDIQNRGKMPIFVGGTGLYFQALNGGLSQMPDVPENIRKKWRNKLEEEGISSLHTELLKVDPLMGEKLKPADKQRIARALEIFDATGKSISYYQTKKGEALIEPDQAKKIVLLPPRPILHQRIADRFARMVELGALYEVEQLLKTGADENHTSMKAIGVRELKAYIDGTSTLEQAIERAIISTRQYAKRQSTWFRNQLDDSWLYPESV